MSPSLRSIGLLFTLVLLWTTALQAQPITYTITDLGPVITVDAIAPDGSMITSSQLVSGEQTAFLVRPTSTNLGYLPQGVFSKANGVNSTTVVGYAGTGRFSLFTHAFVWTAATGMHDLGTTGTDDLFSAAIGINGAGTIVGHGDAPDRSRLVPLVWMAGTVSILPTLSTGDATAVAINEQGDITGWAATGDGHTHAVLWPIDGGLVDLDPAATPLSFAFGINSARQVVGFEITPQGTRGFVWAPDTGIVPLPPLPGDMVSYATAINDTGTIVGRSVFLGPTADQVVLRAVRWDQGVAVELLPLVRHHRGWTLTNATGISEDGSIVGVGMLHGEQHGYLLTPRASRRHRMDRVAQR
jgi:probable HAF family extracellular repeat protein